MLSTSKYSATPVGLTGTRQITNNGGNIIGLANLKFGRVQSHALHLTHLESVHHLLWPISGVTRISQCNKSSTESNLPDGHGHGSTSRRSNDISQDIILFALDR